MKKPVLLLVVLGALVAFAVYYQENRNKRVNSARLVGAPIRTLLLPNLPVSDIAKVRIKDGEKKTSLSVKGDSWVVEERSDYPAAYDKIQRLVGSLSELKIIGKQVVDKNALGKIKLITPGDEAKEGTGTLVELLNAKGDVLASLIAGGTVESSGGASSGNFMGGPGAQRFVTTPKDENTAWLVADGLDELQASAEEWINKAFVDVSRIKSVEVTFANADDSWKAQRPDEETEFSFVESKNGDSLDTAKASGLATILTSSTFVDIVPKAAITKDFMKDSSSAKITTFDGFTYNLKLVERKDAGAEAEPRSFVQVTVSADIPKERKAAPDEKPEDKKTKDAAFASEKKTLEDKLAREKKLEPWTFEILGYTIVELTKKRAELARDKSAGAPEAATTPGQPSAGGSPMSSLQGRGPLAPAPSANPPVTVTTPPVSVESARPAPAPKPEAAAPAPAPAPAAPPAEVKPAEPVKPKAE